MEKISLNDIRNMYEPALYAHNFIKQKQCFINCNNDIVQVCEIQKSTFSRQYYVHFGLDIPGLRRINQEKHISIGNSTFYFNFMQFATSDIAKRRFLIELMNYENKDISSVIANAALVLHEMESICIFETLEEMSTYDGLLKKYNVLGYKDFFMTFHCRNFLPEQIIEHCKIAAKNE